MNAYAYHCRVLCHTRASSGAWRAPTDHQYIRHECVQREKKCVRRDCEEDGMEETKNIAEGECVCMFVIAREEELRADGGRKRDR